MITTTDTTKNPESPAIEWRPVPPSPWKSWAWVGNLVLLWELVCLILSVISFGSLIADTMFIPERFFTWLKPLTDVWSCSAIAKVGQTVGLTGLAFAWLISSASHEILGISMRELVKWAYPETYFCYFITYLPMLIMMIYVGNVEDKFCNNAVTMLPAVSVSFFTSMGALVLLFYTLRISYVLLLSPEKRRHIILGFYIAHANGSKQYHLIHVVAGPKKLRLVRCDSEEHDYSNKTQGILKRVQDWRKEKKEKNEAEKAAKRDAINQERAAWCRKGIQVATKIEARYYPFCAGELALLWKQNCVDAKIETLLADFLQEQENVDTGQFTNMLRELSSAWTTLFQAQMDPTDQDVTVRHILHALSWTNAENVFLIVALADAILRSVGARKVSVKEALAHFWRLMPETRPDVPSISAEQSKYLLWAVGMQLLLLSMYSNGTAAGENADAVDLSGTSTEVAVALNRFMEEWEQVLVAKRTELAIVRHTWEPNISAIKLLNMFFENCQENVLKEKLEQLHQKLETKQTELAQLAGREKITNIDLAKIRLEVERIMSSVGDTAIVGERSSTEKPDAQESTLTQSDIDELLLKFLLEQEDSFRALMRVATSCLGSGEQELLMLCSEMVFRERCHISYIEWQRMVCQKLLNDKNATSAIAQFLPRLWHTALFDRNG